MKKVAIVTACRTNNMGTDIQALAMQHIFSKYADTEIINYKCKKLERSHRLMSKISLWDFLFLPYRIHKNISHFFFRKKHFKFSKKTYTPSDLHTIKDAYEAMVVGSDQIWNLDITGNDLNFFLPFDSTAKKYAYAPSFGVSSISAWEGSYRLSNLLKDFDGISTRDEIGVKNLEEIGITASEKLDPILAVETSLWDSFYKPAKRKPYILIYSVGGSLSLYQDAIEYAKSKNWDVIRIAPPSKPRPHIKNKSFVSVAKWISMMQNAEIVMTNSYHGLSFCIANKKNFRLAKLPKEEKNIRSVLLLEKLHLEDFKIETQNFESTPNWQNVYELLEVYRSDADNYVRKICY